MGGVRVRSRGASATGGRTRAPSPSSAMSASPMSRGIRGLSGQPFVPIVTDGDRVIHDSWNIARYLEDLFPDRPSLFAGPGGRGLARLVNHWSDNMLGAAIRRLIAADFILLPRSRRPRLLPQLTRS